MKADLRPVDHEPLASDPHQPRWRKTAQWARFSMASIGFLDNDSPRRIWAITEEGRIYLRQQQDASS